MCAQVGADTPSSIVSNFEFDLRPRSAIAAAGPPVAPTPSDADALVPSIEVVSNDLAAAAQWCEPLRQEGLHLRLRCSTVEAACEVGSAPFQARILFVARGLPDQLGALRLLREREPLVPLLTVCLELRDLDHVLALEMGADDVLDAATASTVVAARLRALWRRGRAAASRGQGVDCLHFGRLSLHLRERCVRLADQLIALTEGEFEVLWLLATRAGHPVPRTEMLRELRGLPYQRLDRSIDCRVYRLRAKLGDDAGRNLRTVRNCGYLFSSAPW